MNMDIVNPIPPSTLIESNCVNVTPVGLAASFSLMLTKLKRKMPAGLPISSPRTIPRVTGESPPEDMLLKSRATPALARANSGIMMNVTIGCSLLSNLCRSGSTLLSSVLMLWMMCCCSGLVRTMVLRLLVSLNFSRSRLILLWNLISFMLPLEGMTMARSTPAIVA